MPSEGNVTEPQDEFVQPEGDPRPWETPGATRHDCAPHRGNWLVLLGTLALVCGLLSFCIPLLGLAALATGLAVTNLAEGDLERIREGTMDPVGVEDADMARHQARRGIVLGLIALVAHAVILAFLLDVLW